MRERIDGSIQSFNTPTSENIGRDFDDRLFRAMVIDTIFIDDPRNTTRNSDSPRVLYNVVTLGGLTSGQVLSYCRMAPLFSGNNNSFERVLKAATKPLSETRLEDQDGDIVFVQFVQGHSDYPLIVALDQGVNTADSGITPATAEDGNRLKSQFNGVVTEINRKGEWCLLKRAAEFNEETGELVLKPLTEEPNFDGEFKILEKTMLWRDPKSGIEFSRENSLLTIYSGEEREVSEVFDGANEKITKTFKSGMVIEEDGKSDKVKITTSAGTFIEVDGASNTVRIGSGANVIEVNGNSGKISLSGSLVDIGTAVSDIPVLLTQLTTLFNTHTHLVPQSISGVLPSQPPLVPMTPAQGSTTVKVSS